jgi:hypothetical protein
MEISSHEVSFVLLVNVGLLRSNPQTVKPKSIKKRKTDKPVASGIKYVGLNCKPDEYAVSKKNNMVEHPRYVCRITILTNFFSPWKKGFF